MQKRLGWRFNQRLSIPDWREHRFDGLRFARKVLVTRPQNFVGYYPMWEGNGAISYDNSPQGNNGLYTGVTLAQLGIGDGRYSPFFDGVSDFNNISSAAFNADFNGSAGTVIIPRRVANVGVWTDGAIRHLIHLFVDAANEVRILKAGAANTVFIDYRAGGVLRSVGLGAENDVDWMNYGLTWDINAGATGEVRGYKNGVQQGAILVGLGAWAGNLAVDRTVIGANRIIGPTNPWHGFLAHVPVWNMALTPGEMAFVVE